MLGYAYPLKRDRVEEEHAWLEAEVEARLVEEARLKAEEEEQAR